MADGIEPDALAVAQAQGLNANQLKEFLPAYSQAISLKRIADRLDQAGATLKSMAAKSRIV